MSYQGKIALHGVRSQKVKIAKVKYKSDKQKMAEQIMSEAISKAVAEATRIAIQAMAEMQVQRIPNAAGPKLGSPTLKQPTFDWQAKTNIQSRRHLFWR